MKVKIIDEKSGRQIDFKVYDWTNNADWQNGRAIGTYVAYALKKSYIASDCQKGEVKIEIA